MYHRCEDSHDNCASLLIEMPFVQFGVRLGNVTLVVSDKKVEPIF